MTQKFTAKMYLDKVEIMQKSGDNLDELYACVLAHAQDNFGNVHGEIIDNTTQQVVRKFRKAPPE